MNNPRTAPAPLDQADGLRRLFAQSRVRVIPVVSNPHMAFGGVMLERVCTAFAVQGAQVLVVDASERAPVPHEVALMELVEGIEPLSAQVSYLAARGLALRYVDTHGSTAVFIQALIEAAPYIDVILVHAPAIELCRMLGRSSAAWSQDARPLVLVDDRPTSVTHAYAGVKLLSQRAHLVVHDFLLGAAPQSPRAPRIAAQLRTCAEHFLGAVVRDVFIIDPATDALEAPPDALRRWAQECLSKTDATRRLFADAEGAQKPPLRYLPPTRPTRAELNSWS